MAENLNTAITVEAWAEITIKEWQNKIKELGIGVSKNKKGDTVISTGQLLASFYHHVKTSADGIPEYINFAFEYYGRMVDWGVGRGVTLEDRDKLVFSEGTSREQKPWFSKVFQFHYKRLVEIMAEKYAQQATVVVINDLQAANKSEPGEKTTRTKRSGSGGIDSVTGRKKITMTEFEKMRKQQGW